MTGRQVQDSNGQEKNTAARLFVIILNAAGYGGQPGRAASRIRMRGQARVASESQGSRLSCQFCGEGRDLQRTRISQFHRDVAYRTVIVSSGLGKANSRPRRSLGRLDWEKQVAELVNTSHPRSINLRTPTTRCSSKRLAREGASGDQRQDQDRYCSHAPWTGRRAARHRVPRRVRGDGQPGWFDIRGTQSVEKSLGVTNFALRLGMHRRGRLNTSLFPSRLTLRPMEKCSPLQPRDSLVWVCSDSALRHCQRSSA